MQFWISVAQIGPLTFRERCLRPPQSLPPPSQTYIAPVSLISVILSVIQALLQCHHKCVFNVINDFVVVGQMAATLPRWRNVKSGARNDERGAGRQIWGQVLLNLQGNVVQISRQLFLSFFSFTAHVDQDSWTVLILSHSPVIGHGRKIQSGRCFYKSQTNPQRLINPSVSGWMTSNVPCPAMRRFADFSWTNVDKAALSWNQLLFSFWEPRGLTWNRGIGRSQR